MKSVFEELREEVAKFENSDVNKLLEWVYIQLDLVAERGYKLIEGLYDTSSDNVYKIMALCKNPDGWGPYAAPRYFGETDAFAICWWFERDLTDENMNGDMVYEDFDEYEDLEGEDTFETCENPVWMRIAATQDGLTEDDLINAAVEVMARADYQVGGFKIESHSHNPNMWPWITGYMDLINYATVRGQEFEGYGVEIDIPSGYRHH